MTKAGTVQPGAGSSAQYQELEEGRSPSPELTETAEKVKATCKIPDSAKLGGGIFTVGGLVTLFLGLVVGKEAAIISGVVTGILTVCGMAHAQRTVGDDDN